MNNGPFKEDGFQHYYLRTKSGQPYGVVVVAPGDTPDTVHRGISLCSSLDVWDRIAGRRKAVGRAKKAMGCKRSADNVGNVNAGVVATFAVAHSENYIDEKFAIYKSGYNVAATEKELVIIENLLKKQA